MARKIDAIWSCEGGQSIVEYALILAMILVLIAGILGLVGSRSNRVYSHAADAFQSHTTPD